MKAVWSILIVLALMGGAAAVGYFAGHRAAAPAPETSDSDDSIEPTPTVQTTPIRQGRVDRKIIAYGVVAARAGDESVLSVAFESRVKKILVAGGQHLDAATPVIELEPSSDTQLQMLQAKSALESANQDLQQTRRRFTDHLATNQDLLQSQQNLRQAELKYDSLQKAGGGGPVQLKAAGLVVHIDVQEGQVVPAGGSLMEITAGGRLQVRLGVEPSDAASLRTGDAVSLELVRADAPAVNGTIQMIAQRVNPDTRFTDVFVSLPSNSPLPLDVYIRGTVTLAGADGLIVPRSAVLPDDDGFSLFTVDQGKASERKVSIAAQDDQFMQISGDGVASGQMAVVVGNMELEDGMSVKIAGGRDESAATQPTTQEAAR